MSAQLIVEQPGTFGAYGFSHALIRETLHEELTLTRRVLLHRRIGEALEELYAGSVDPHLAELAHHFYEAAQDRHPARAIDYGERAGKRAAGMLAYEEAVRLYERALHALELATQPQERRRCELLIGRGEAERLAGNPAYRETLLGASRLAQELGDAERLGRAALANNRGFFSATSGVDRERVSLLEVALEADGTGDSPRRDQSPGAARGRARGRSRLAPPGQPQRRCACNRAPASGSSRIVSPVTASFRRR